MTHTRDLSNVLIVTDRRLTHDGSGVSPDKRWSDGTGAHEPVVRGGRMRHVTRRQVTLRCAEQEREVDVTLRRAWREGVGFSMSQLGLPRALE